MLISVYTSAIGILTALIPENCCPACRATTRHNGMRNLGVARTRVRLHFSWFERLEDVLVLVSSHAITLVGRFRNLDSSKIQKFPMLWQINFALGWYDKYILNTRIFCPFSRERKIYLPCSALSSSLTIWYKYFGLSGNHGSDTKTKTVIIT